MLLRRRGLLLLVPLTLYCRWFPICCLYCYVVHCCCHYEYHPWHCLCHFFGVGSLVAKQLRGGDGLLFQGVAESRSDRNDGARRIQCGDQDSSQRSECNVTIGQLSMEVFDLVTCLNSCMLCPNLVPLARIVSMRFSVGSKGFHRMVAQPCIAQDNLIRNKCLSFAHGTFDNAA